MTRKKGKLMTFLWSLIPGAGEMYLGFFKCGASLMAIFFILLGVSGFLQLNFLTFLTPIVWFYSFFHTNNLNSLSDEDFYALEDDFILKLGDFAHNRTVIAKYRKLLAGCLIFFGISILWNNFSHLILWYFLPMLNLSNEMRAFMQFFANSIPQSVVAIAIIVAGLYLIRGKYRELSSNDIIPDPPYLKEKGGAKS